MTNPFAHVATEHMRMKYFQKLGDYIPPENYGMCRQGRASATTNEGGKGAVYFAIESF